MVLLIIHLFKYEDKFIFINSTSLNRDWYISKRYLLGQRTFRLLVKLMQRLRLNGLQNPLPRSFEQKMTYTQLYSKNYCNLLKVIVLLEANIILNADKKWHTNSLHCRVTTL